MLRFQSHSFIHSFIHPSIHPLSIRVPILRSSPTKHGGEKCGHCPCSPPHAHKRPTYNGMRPGSQRGLFMRLLLLPQCHAAFGMIPSTLASADKSYPAYVAVTLYRMSPLHLLPLPLLDTGYGWLECVRVTPSQHTLHSCYHLHITLRYKMR